MKWEAGEVQKLREERGGNATRSEGGMTTTGAGGRGVQARKAPHSIPFPPSPQRLHFEEVTDGPDVGAYRNKVRW